MSLSLKSPIAVVRACNANIAPLLMRRLRPYIRSIDVIPEGIHCAITAYV